jgi:hypothetical protein
LKERQEAGTSLPVYISGPSTGAPARSLEREDAGRGGLLEIPEEHAEMGFNEGGGAGEVWPVLVKIDGVGHRSALVTEKLSPMLRGDDADGVSGETMAKRLNRDFRQAGAEEDKSPGLIESEERPTRSVTRNCEVFRAGRSGYRLEQAHRLGTEIDPSATPFAAISFGPGNSESRNLVVEMAPVVEGPEELGAVPGARVDRQAQSKEGTEGKRSREAAVAQALKIADDFANGRIACGL